MTNRGARGWEPPPLRWSSPLPRRPDVLVASWVTLNGCRFVESDRDVIDMVQVDGVWMVPEDARG
jgi:hypothetical protein